MTPAPSTLRRRLALWLCPELGRELWVARIVNEVAESALKRAGPSPWASIWRKNQRELGAGRPLAPELRAQIGELIHRAVSEGWALEDLRAAIAELPGAERMRESREAGEA